MVLGGCSWNLAGGQVCCVVVEVLGIGAQCVEKNIMWIVEVSIAL